MRSSAFQISVYYKEYNQNIKIFNTNKYSQENVIKNIYIYQHSRRVPDRLKPWPMKIRNQKISNQENSKRKILLKKLKSSEGLGAYSVKKIQKAGGLFSEKDSESWGPIQ